MNKLLLIDGHSILNRAFYGLPDLTNGKGQHTNAVLGFLNILLKLLEEEHPTHLCVAFDVHEPTFRHKQFAQYKGTRKPMPEELRTQVPMMKQVLKAMGITILEKGGYEADDILGTLSRIGEKEGYQVSIVSGDRDLLQLATDKILIRIPKTKAAGTVMEDYYEQDVVEKYQVTPTEFIDLKGLMGDTADNIPGVPGIGEKTAAKIIKEYHTIENAYAHIEEIKPNKAKENLQTYYEQAILSKELATIKLDCELDFVLTDAQVENLFTDEAYEILKELEFKTLLKKFTAQEIKTEKIEYEIITDFARADQVVHEIIKGERCGLYGLAGDNGEVQCLSLCDEKENVYIIPTEGFISQAYLKDWLQEFYAGDITLCVMDLKELLHLIKPETEKMQILDIGVAAYLLNPMKDTYGYDDIARDFLSMTVPAKTELLGKEKGDSFEIENENFAAVLAYHAKIPFMAYHKVREALREKDMLTLYEEIELPTIYALYDMEKWGVRVNGESLEEYGKELKVHLDALEKSIYELAGETFNINSPKQLGQVLFEHLKLPNGKKTKTGYSTSVDVLENLKNEYPIVEQILEYRQYAKLKSTYADGLANFIGPDGRIHGKFNQTITATGRISSTEPNLQNIPMKMPLGREIRKVFIPEDGYVFVDADYSQIELRVLAHLSGDDTLIHAFQNELDIHAITASEVFNVPIEQVDSIMRRNAKAVNFGIVYGISAFGLSQDLHISRKEASDYINKYFETYKDVKNFLDHAVEQAKKEGFVRTLFNRIRPIPELSSSNFMQRSFGERVAMNSPIQGTAADIIKIAMVHVNQQLKARKLKSRLVLQIHDELLIEAFAHEVDLVKEIVTKEMMEAASLLVPLSIDIHDGENWLAAK